MTALWSINAQTEQVSGTPDFGHNDTMGYYTQADLPFYYGLAQTFAVSDRYFCSVVGPTLPNRSYELAATSFGHVTTNEIFPPGIDPANPSPLNTSIGYQPVTGTIFDLLDKAGVHLDQLLRGSAHFGDFPRQPHSISGGAYPHGVYP